MQESKADQETHARATREGEDDTGLLRTGHRRGLAGRTSRSTFGLCLWPDLSFLRAGGGQG